MVSQETASRIIVMGPTGSGKSTFINLVSGSTLSVSDGLKSCTSEVLESRPFTLDNQTVILVDTPGFDDTARPNTDIISTISTYLADMHRHGVKLCGVIYMHRISDQRIRGASLLHFRIFHLLCGNESLRNALIVTTMWSRVDPKLGERRERELAAAEDLFKPVLDNGARLVPHSDTLESAEDILRFFIANKGMTLRIQRELVDEGKRLIDTAAGAELYRVFTNQAQRLDAESRKLQNQIQEASYVQDLEGWTMLESELDKTQKEKKRFEYETERLRGMTSSVINTDIVRLASTGLVEYLGGRPHYDDNLHAWLPTRGPARVEPQGRSNEVQKARKCTRNENECLREDANVVLEAIENLKSRCTELHNDLRAATQDRQDRTKPFAKQVDQTAEEMLAMQQQFDAVIEWQREIIAELKRREERESMWGRMVRWIS